MRVVICAIAKHENKYINDWAHYYFNLGFDHIYLYDNNLSKDPYVGDCFDESIKDKITIFNVQNICGKDIQERSYNNFYQNYKNTFDWCLFCDIDEFLDLNGEFTTINDFLSNDKFKEFDQIRVRWRLFGDDDLLERDESIPVYKFFKKPVAKQDKGYIYQGKTIVRGGLENVYMSIHVALQDTLSRDTVLKSCLPSGREYKGIYLTKLDKNNVYDYEGETIYLNHYRTKTLKEFLDQKYGRTCCCMSGLVTIEMNYFFATNKDTPEKQKYIKKWFLKKLEERRK